MVVNIPKTSRFVRIRKGEKTIKLVVGIKQSKLLQAITEGIIRNLDWWHIHKCNYGKPHITPTATCIGIQKIEIKSLRSKILVAPREIHFYRIILGLGLTPQTTNVRQFLCPPIHLQWFECKWLSTTRLFIYLFIFIFLFLTEKILLVQWHVLGLLTIQTSTMRCNNDHQRCGREVLWVFCCSHCQVTFHRDWFSFVVAEAF